MFCVFLLTTTMSNANWSDSDLDSSENSRYYNQHGVFQNTGPVRQNHLTTATSEIRDARLSYVCAAYLFTITVLTHKCSIPSDQSDRWFQYAARCWDFPHEWAWGTLLGYVSGTQNLSFFSLYVTWLTFFGSEIFTRSVPNNFL